jgi:hypothetical protein
MGDINITQLGNMFRRFLSYNWEAPLHGDLARCAGRRATEMYYLLFKRHEVVAGGMQQIETLIKYYDDGQSDVEEKRTV